MRRAGYRNLTSGARAHGLFCVGWYYHSKHQPSSWFRNKDFFLRYFAQSFYFILHKKLKSFTYFNKKYAECYNILYILFYGLVNRYPRVMGYQNKTLYRLGFTSSSLISWLWFVMVFHRKWCFRMIFGNCTSPSLKM